jgi:stage II sporulation protein D
MRLLGDEGSFIDVEGLAIRRILDVPENLFDATPSGAGAHPSGWRFDGRGWGHGVGMCQLGAFRMARRGLSHEQILSHYYSGVDLVRLAPLPRAENALPRRSAVAGRLP